MKKIILLICILTTSAFADVGFRVYNYTYTNKTQKCAVTVFVPDSGSIKIEKLCFNIK